MVRMTYKEKLKDPRWLRLRSIALDLAEHKCSDCEITADTRTLEVHHKVYLPKREPWDYEVGDLRCLCSLCHEEHERVKIAYCRMLGSFSWMEVDMFLEEFREAIELRNVDPGYLLRHMRSACGQFGREERT